MHNNFLDRQYPKPIVDIIKEHYDNYKIIILNKLSEVLKNFTIYEEYIYGINTSDNLLTKCDLEFDILYGHGIPGYSNTVTYRKAERQKQEVKQYESPLFNKSKSLIFLKTQEIKMEGFIKYEKYLYIYIGEN